MLLNGTQSAACSASGMKQEDGDLLDGPDREGPALKRRRCTPDVSNGEERPLKRRRCSTPEQFCASPGAASQLPPREDTLVPGAHYTHTDACYSCFSPHAT